VFEFDYASPTNSGSVQTHTGFHTAGVTEQLITHCKTSKRNQGTHDLIAEAGNGLIAGLSLEYATPNKKQ
jgi:hypothetical protein